MTNNQPSNTDLIAAISGTYIDYKSGKTITFDQNNLKMTESGLVYDSMFKVGYSESFLHTTIVDYKSKRTDQPRTLELVRLPSTGSGGSNHSANDSGQLQNDLKEVLSGLLKQQQKQSELLTALMSNARPAPVVSPPVAQNVRQVEARRISNAQSDRSEPVTNFTMETARKAQKQARDIPIPDKRPFQGLKDSRTFVMFKSRVETRMRQSVLDEPTKYFYLLNCLDDSIREKMETTIEPQPNPDSYSQAIGTIWQELDKHFGGYLDRSKIQTEYINLKMKANEKLSDYCDRFEKVLRSYEEISGYFENEELVKEKWILSLTDFWKTQLQMSKREPWHTLVQLGVEAERTGTKDPGSFSSHLNLLDGNASNFTGGKGGKRRDPGNGGKQIRSSYSFSSNHFGKGKGKLNTNYSDSQRVPFNYYYNHANDNCKRCGKNNHEASTCWSTYIENIENRCKNCGVNSRVHTSCSSANGRNCARCGGTGHLACVCPVPWAQIKNGKVDVNNTETSSKPVVLDGPTAVVDAMSYSKSCVKDSLKNTEISIETRSGSILKLKGLFDSGATRTIIREDVFNDLINDGLYYEYTGRSVGVRVASEKVIWNCKVYKILVNLTGISFPAEVIVSKYLSHPSLIHLGLFRSIGVAWLATPEGDRIVWLGDQCDMSKVVEELKKGSPRLPVPEQTILNDEETNSAIIIDGSVAICELAKKVAIPLFVTSLTSESGFPLNYNPDSNPTSNITKCDFIDCVANTCNPVISSTCEVEVDDTCVNFSNDIVKDSPVKLVYKVAWSSDERPKYNFNFAKRSAEEIDRKFHSDAIDTYHEELMKFVEIGAAKEVEKSFCRYFLPHFAVRTKTNSSMRLRPVFNAAYVNNFLKKGLIINRDTIEGLLLLRRYRYFFTEDQSKAFCRLALIDTNETCENDTFYYGRSDSISEDIDLSGGNPYFCFYWRERFYTFTAVFYGSVSSPANLQDAMLRVTNEIRHEMSTENVQGDFHINFFMDDTAGGSLQCFNLWSCIRNYLLEK
jgi:hypothetical protein